MPEQDQSITSPASTSTEYALVCQLCDGQTERAVTESDGVVIRCTRCGTVGDEDKVIQTARAYFEHCFGYGKIDGFQRRLSVAMESLPNVVYTPSQLPKFAQPDFVFRKVGR